MSIAGYENLTLCKYKNILFNEGSILRPHKEKANKIVVTSPILYPLFERKKHIRKRPTIKEVSKNFIGKIAIKETIYKALLIIVF